MKDPIERQEVMDAIYKCTDVYVNNLPIMIYKAELYKAISEVPPAEPEMNFDEWCTDCKEYDHEKHCCPRWNRVIRQALSEQPKIIHCRDCKYSTDFYQDGCCYCKMPYKEMRYIEEGWDFYCAAGKEGR